MTVEKLSDEALVKEFQMGSNRAFEELLERYREFIFQKTSNYYMAGGEKEDIVQLGMIGLFKAAVNYSDEKKASFKTYVSTCVENNIISGVTLANRNKHKPLNESMSYDIAELEDSEDFKNEHLLTDNNTSNPENMYIAKYSAIQLLKAINEQLSMYEQVVLGYCIKGLGYSEIAATLGKTPKSIDNALSRIKAKVANVLKNY